MLLRLIIANRVELIQLNVEFGIILKHDNITCVI